MLFLFPPWQACLKQLAINKLTINNQTRIINYMIHINIRNMCSGYLFVMLYSHPSPFWSLQRPASEMHGPHGPSEQKGWLNLLSKRKNIIYIYIYITYLSLSLYIYIYIYLSLSLYIYIYIHTRRLIIV